MSSFVDKEFQKIKHKYSLTTPRDLIEQAGINLLKLPLDDNTGGFTVTNNRCSTIVINELWSEQYQRFVILHEFSHLKLHGWASTPFFRRTGTGNYIVPKIEHEANELAIDILIEMQDKDDIAYFDRNQLAYFLGISPELLKDY